MTADSREQLADAILDRLIRAADAIRADFRADPDVATHFAVVDDLIPLDAAARVHAAFPPVGGMRRLSSFRERKFTSKSLDDFDPLIAEITFAFQDPRVVRQIAELTGFTDVLADPHLYAGGISAMTAGDFLHPHIDNSHDVDHRHHRVLNLLYYCSPDWTAADGGSLELWDEQGTSKVEVPALFNRLVLMSTHGTSWHSVNTVTADRLRTCVSNYYFSPDPPDTRASKHVTYFRGRPEDRVGRVVLKIDSELRTALRRVRSRGFGRRDVYEGGPTPGHDS